MMKYCIQMFFMFTCLTVIQKPAFGKTPVGVFDISFWGIEEVLATQLANDFVIPKHSLYSPHGVAVASLIFNPIYGGSEHATLAVANPGIYPEDFRRGIQLAVERKVRLINASIRLVNSELVDLINRAHSEHGMMFVVSAGNSAVELGRDLPAYYSQLEAIVVSCLDRSGQLPDFAQLSSRVDFLVHCGDKEVKTLINDQWRGIVEYDFGMTSAGAPQVTAMVADLLIDHPTHDLAEVKLDLARQAVGSFFYAGKSFPILSRQQKFAHQAIH